MSSSTSFLISSLILLLLHHTTSSHPVSGPEIADGDILLPPKKSHAVEYRIHGGDGCFTWSWDDHDILVVLPEFNSSSQYCSTSARLKSIAPYSGRQKTTVSATDFHNGTIVRYRVYVDEISRIEIFNNPLKLYFDAFAPLRVRAFDSEDNVFSSLVGLRFMWQMMPETHGLPRNLVHVPLKDSPLSDYGGFFGDSDIQVNLEESGVFSDLCVVKGTEIGVSIVSVSLLESSSRYLKDEITLTVAEAMSLDPPSPVYVLIGAVVRYTLKSIRSNMPRVVSLPSPFHHWSASNSSVAEVDGETGTARALSLGATQVVVRDTRILGQMQISSLHIVLPDNLVLFLRPLYLCGDCNFPAASRWYLVAGQQYIIHLMALSSTEMGTHEVSITANDEIVIDLDHWGQFFCNILPVSVRVANKNKYRLLIAYSSGSEKLIATLAYRTGHGIKKEVLKVSQEFTVCDQIEFVKERAGNRFNRILLPWVPCVYQEFQLKANGGCAVFSSHYKWLSLDAAVVSVSASGIVRARKPGNATIRVVSIFDPLNYDEMVIEVSVPSSLVILPIFPVEVPVGSHLQASVTLRASSGAYFHACDAFGSYIRWKTESESFVIVNATLRLLAVRLNSSSSSSSPACASTLIYPSGPGRTIVHATLNRENRPSESNVLNVSLRVAAYSPLTIHQASDGNRFGGYWFDTARIGSWNELGRSDDVNLALGTYLDVMLSGGPERWGEDVEFVETVDVIDEGKTYAKSRIFLDRISTVNGNLYRIGCKSLEPFSVIFRRGNLIGEEHRFTAVSEAEMVIICSCPSYIIIIPDEELNAHPVIRSARGAERMVTVANGREIRMSAVGICNFDIAFANSSSFILRWELSGCEGLAVFDDSKGYSSWERFLKLQSTSGRCTVRSTIVGFNDSLSNPDLSMVLGSYVDLTAAIQLQLVSPIRVSPEFSLLFFSPVARLNISIIGGSCYFDRLVNDTEIVEIHACDDCSQLTLAPKSVGSALVTVRDIGLVHPLSASSTVQVAEMDWIKILTGGGHIRIMEGSFESVNVSVGVDDGRVFDPSQYVYMGIRVDIEENIVEVVDDYDFSILSERCVRGQNLVLQAMRLGVTTIYLSATKPSGHKILSQPVMLEVYSPPRLHPSDIFLVPGSSYALTVRGGPKIGSRIQYSSMDDQTAEIHKFSGRLSAISPGNCTLIATIYGDGDIILCEAYGRVKVGIPSSAVLNVQSEHIAIDRTMPIYPCLSEGNLFSFYELCNNFKWTVEDKDVLNFHVASKSHGTGHSIVRTFRPTDPLNGQDLNFIQVLQGKSSGKTNVTVSFSCDYKLSSSVSKSLSYSASISLWVVSNLPLALGSQATWIIPSYYTSSELLPHSSHAYKKGYSLSDEGIDYSLVHFKRKIEEVRDDDICIDGNKIVTKESGDLACIQAKDRSTGRAEVASCVRVAEITQIRIMTDEFPVHTLAVGSELDFPIKYHDALGNPFHESHNITLFEVETNYPDVVSIEEHNGNIHLQAKSQGLALVQIAFVSDPRKSIYAIISVGPQLYPSNPVISQGSDLDSHVNGLSDLTSDQLFSGNVSIVFVERLSEKAEGVGESAAHVHFESLSSSFELHNMVTVLKGNTVLVDTKRVPPVPEKKYGFDIKLSKAKKMTFSFDNADPHLALSWISRGRFQKLEIRTTSIRFSDSPVSIV